MAGGVLGPWVRLFVFCLCPPSRCPQPRSFHSGAPMVSLGRVESLGTIFEPLGMRLRLSDPRTPDPPMPREPGYPGVPVGLPRIPLRDRESGCRFQAVSKPSPDPPAPEPGSGVPPGRVLSPATGLLPMGFREDWLKGDFPASFCCAQPGPNRPKAKAAPTENHRIPENRRNAFIPFFMIPSFSPRVPRSGTRNP